MDELSKHLVHYQFPLPLQFPAAQGCQLSQAYNSVRAGINLAMAPQALDRHATQLVCQPQQGQATQRLAVPMEPGLLPTGAVW